MPFQLPLCRVSKPKRAISKALMNIPPPQCPPPLTLCTGCPSNTIHEFLYPVQRQVAEAPMGSIIVCFNTCGKGFRHTLVAARARAFTLTSLYSYTVPLACLERFIQLAALLSGLSAHSGLPQRVPSQSLVCRSISFQVIVRLCVVAKMFNSCGCPISSEDR